MAMHVACVYLDSQGSVPAYQCSCSLVFDVLNCVYFENTYVNNTIIHVHEQSMNHISLKDLDVMHSHPLTRCCTL